MKKYNGYALITGGDIGIGEAFAEQLAEQGYDLVLVARNKDNLKKTQDLIVKKYGVKVLVLVKDLTENDAAAVVMDFVKKQKIHIALLVNNAGFLNFHTFVTSDLKADINMIELMCRNMVELTYTLLPAMIERGEGGIIIVSSITSRLHLPYFAVYSACKKFEEGFGVILSYELESKNIDVLVVCPGVVKTHFWDDNNAIEKINYGAKKVLGLKALTPDKVAKRSLAALGRKTVIQGGHLLDRIFFYTSHLMPLRIERWFLRWYLRQFYNLDY